MSADIPAWPADHHAAAAARPGWAPGGPGPGKTPSTGSVTPAPAPAAGTLRLTCTVSVADPCGRPATQLLIADDPTFGLTTHPRCEQHPAEWYGALLDKAGIGTAWLIVDLYYAGSPPGGPPPAGGPAPRYIPVPPALTAGISRPGRQAAGAPYDPFGGAQGSST